MEICHGSEASLPDDAAAAAAEDTASRFPATPADHRARQGGAFLYQPADARAAHRDNGSVAAQFAFLGLHVVRSVK